MYINGIRLVGDSDADVKQAKDPIRQKFMARIENNFKILGIATNSTSSSTKLHHGPLIERTLKFFGMKHCPPVNIPLAHGTDRSISGSVRDGELSDEV